MSVFLPHRLEHQPKEKLKYVVYSSLTNSASKLSWCMWLEHVRHLVTYRCPRRKGQNFGRVFLMLKYTDITQNTYIQSWTVTEIMAIEKCGLLAGLRTVPCQLTALRLSDHHCRVRLQKYHWRWAVNCLPIDNVVHGAAALYSAWNP